MKNTNIIGLNIHQCNQCAVSRQITLINHKVKMRTTNHQALTMQCSACDRMDRGMTTIQTPYLTPRLPAGSTFHKILSSDLPLWYEHPQNEDRDAFNDEVDQ